MFYFIIKYKGLYSYTVKDESCIVPKPCFKNISNAKLSSGLKVYIRQFYTFLTASGWNCGVKGLKTDVRIICSRILYVCGCPKMNISIQVSALHKKYLINEHWVFLLLLYLNKYFYFTLVEKKFLTWRIELSFNLPFRILSQTISPFFLTCAF